MFVGVLGTSLGDVGESNSCKKLHFIPSKASTIKTFFNKFTSQILLFTRAKFQGKIFSEIPEIDL